jgi:integrase
MNDDILYFNIHEQWTLRRTKSFPSKSAQLKTRWSERQIPIHPTLRPILDEWLSGGWRAYVGREPKPDDPVFPDAEGNPFREPRSTEFVEDLGLAGCPTEYNGITLTTYSLRHTFATLMLESGVDSDARNRLMGHRPQDVKALAYQVTQLRYLFKEISKIPPIVAECSDDATSVEVSEPQHQTAAAAMK